MSGLRTPHLGPIVGHTTATSATLWIRAQDPNDADIRLAADCRTLGVIAVFAEDGVALPDAKIPIYYFRLRREYDRTGIFVLGDSTGIQDGKKFTLKPDTTYLVRLATLTLDDSGAVDDDVQDATLAKLLPAAAVWIKPLRDPALAAGEAEFRTFPKAPTLLAKGTPPFAFLLGSCRYPGILWRGIKHADQIYGAMQQHVNASAKNPARLVLMVGDQIYGDKFNRHLPLGRAETFEDFQERYHDAFGSKNMRRLMQMAPHYMILDDHEIEDNWSQDRYDRQRQLYTNAMQAYSSYQWIHSPCNYDRRLHYSFNCGGYPFFVMDTRTQRFMGSAASPLDDHATLADNHMLGRPSTTEFSQLSQLLLWLHQQDRNVPKFIVSSSVFVPNAMDVRSGKNPSVKALEECDSWPGFPETRRAILQCIVDNKIQNVVFLSGDIHCSNVAKLYFQDNVTGADLGITAFSVTSSALYWPFAFADGDPAGYVHDSRDAAQFDPFVTDKFTLHYEAFNFTQEDNFCRLEVDAAKHLLRVVAYDYKGDPIVEEKPAPGWNPLKPWTRRPVSVPIATELKLSPW
ncbi:MAG: alkaline phosphatase D family protein [Spongiibacteraceae bacterium]